MNTDPKATSIAAAVLAALAVAGVALAGAPGGREPAGDRPPISVGHTEPAEAGASASREDSEVPPTHRWRAVTHPVLKTGRADSPPLPHRRCG